MKTSKRISVLFMLAGITCVSLLVASVYAHCDTMKGPIVPEAKAAIEKGDITTVLKWVKPEYENEVKAAFSLTLKVRDKSPEAKELADKYFFETLIRLHRAGEGAPYTGLKDTPPDKIVTMADEALAGGSPDKMIKEIQTHLAAAIKEKYDKALQAGKNKDKNVESGREFVEAYVEYMHYVEGIYAAITSTQSHSENMQAGTEQVEHKH